MIILKKYKSVGSTSAIAKKTNYKPWTVIWSEEQTSGHGQKTNYWFSPKGGLYFSIILPKSTIEDLQTLTILASFVVSKVIKDNFKIEPFIKLPNDIFVNQKKISGILTENIIGDDIKFSIMGIGIDTNIEKYPKDLENIATSLKIETGKEINNEQILKEVVRGIKNQLKIIS